MPGWFGRPQLAREDRYVHQCRVRSCGQTSRERISFLLEEALRLVSLPGENEGRVYYLRKVVVSQLTTRASRQAWNDAMRTALMELASSAIHGADSRANAAEAVFFYSHEEALHLLLGRILRREPLDRWFWPLVNGTAVDTTRSQRVLAIVERLRDLPASWLAVADSVISAIGHSDPMPLLTLLPLATVNSWLLELSARQIPFAWLRPVKLPQVLDVMLRRATRAMGSDEPRVVWLASLAVLQSAPAEFNTGRVVYRAQCTLQSLAADRVAPLRDYPDLGPRPRLVLRTEVQPGTDNIPVDSAALWARALGPGTPQLQALAQGIELSEGPAQPVASEDPIVISPVATITNQPDSHRPLRQESSPAPVADTLPRAASHSEHGREPDSDGVLREGALLADGFFIGASTQAAGLYFLLNVLRLLGIAEALQSNAVAAGSGLVARIMQRLAAHAVIEAGDPTLSWVELSLSHIEDLDIPPLEARAIDPSTMFPSNLRPSARDAFDAEYFSRVWSVAVRRWCWHVGGLTVRNVVHRNGLVSLNRTDLDIILPLDSVDVRIRRMGLDIDPGWLPWFGKVVRFHYVWDEPSAQKRRVI